MHSKYYESRKIKTIYILERRENNSFRKMDGHIFFPPPLQGRPELASTLPGVFDD